ncbi:S53 family peptidase [Amycolatopsis sp. NBC_00345]|uniref:S53 family peptidase n=1 Tax=Amycolatopsis sp. NBC_00345 TaxID=2975955 RepID=UPI002E254FFB
MIAASCVAALAIAGTATAGTAPGRVALAGTSRTYDFIDHGAVPAGTPVSESIYLAVKDPAALAAQAKAMSDPHSPGYGRFLSRDRIRELHQLDPAQVGHVRDWLTSAGLNVSRPDWRQLRVTGTFAQLNAAFAVTFHDYTFPPETHIQGHYLIPSTELSVPAGLGPLVLGVGQDTILIRDAKAKTAATQRAVRTPHIDAGQAATCSKYWGELPAKGLPQANGATPPLAPCGYTPQQLRRAYGLDRLNLTGAGQTVAVLSGPMNTLEQDINTWSKHVGTQPLRPGQLTAVPTPDGSPDEDPRDGGAIEATIDAEAVHGLAPDANIVAIGESTAQGTNLLDSLTYVLDRTNASIVSASLGFDPVPGMRKAYDQVFQEGALQGVGFYFCSGDGGFKITDDGRGDWLNPAANSPWETSVGGTSLAIGPDGKRSWETGWGDATSALSPDGASWQAMQSDGGTGGGRAGDRPEPWYQHGVVPDQLATGPDGSHNRVGPDVAMDADPVTGLLVGGTALGGSPTTDPGTWLYTEHKYGGTSLSTPLFAGVQALAQQARGGKPFGFANPIMYQRANSPAFRDVTTYRRPDGNVPTTVSYRPDDKGNNTPTLYSILASQLADGTPDGIVPPEVGPGFDTETGLGTPTTAYLRSFIGS